MLDNFMGEIVYPFSSSPAISRAHSMKSFATELGVRFFKVTIPTGMRAMGSSTGSTLPSGRYSSLGPDFHRLDRWRTYWMTISARPSSIRGTSRPRALAVFRLTASSYFTGACTGRSAGFAPRRM